MGTHILIAEDDMDDGKPFIYVHFIKMDEPGDGVSPHRHDYDHNTVIFSGRALFKMEDGRMVEKRAPDIVKIKAGQMHQVIALEPNTQIACVNRSENFSRRLP